MSKILLRFHWIRLSRVHTGIEQFLEGGLVTNRTLGCLTTKDLQEYFYHTIKYDNSFQIIPKSYEL